MELTWEECGGYVPAMERNHNPTQEEIDAARYRWLRDEAYLAGPAPNRKMTWCVTGEGCSTAEPICGPALDMAIDAALKLSNVKVTGLAPGKEG